MDKITLRKFYDTSGNYKVVRCKTFDEAKKFWKASKKINHLTSIENEKQLEEIYYKQNTKAIFCFSDEDWWANDEFYKNREIYDFSDIILKNQHTINDDLYKVIYDIDLDLTEKEIELIIKAIKKNFNIKTLSKRITRPSKEKL